MRVAISLACCTIAPQLAHAQGGGVNYPTLMPSTYRVTSNVTYAQADTSTLRLDVYRPTAAGVHPTLVFFTSGAQRTNEGYIAWARIAASKGLVAVLADQRMQTSVQDYRLLLSHLMAQGSKYAIDTAAIAVFGASGHAFSLTPIAEDPTETRIKGAVFFYGVGSVAQFRRDLPVLFVRAGLDRPGLNTLIDSTIGVALKHNAPISVINYSGGHHGFEFVDNGQITTDVIDQTVAFVKRVTARSYRNEIARTLAYATAASHVASNNFAMAANVFSGLVEKSPNDAALGLSYVEALLGDRQFARACEHADKLKGRDLGPRDLGLPSARACLGMGDQERAMSWLKSIPKRFIPPNVKDEIAFAALKDRADFQELFKP